MKKLLTVLLMMMIAGTAFAGPVDYEGFFDAVTAISVEEENVRIIPIDEKYEICIPEDWIERESYSEDAVFAYEGVDENGNHAIVHVMIVDGQDVTTEQLKGEAAAMMHSRSMIYGTTVYTIVMNDDGRMAIVWLSDGRAYAALAEMENEDVFSSEKLITDLHKIIRGIRETDDGEGNAAYTYYQETGTVVETPLSDILSEGHAGDTIRWFLTQNGLLYVFGEGALKDFIFPYSSWVEEGTTSEVAPWSDFRDQIVEVIIEEGITEIGNYAFYDCSELRTISIPASMEYISDAAIWSCPNLECIEVAADNSSYQSIDGILFGKENSRLMIYPANKAGATYSVPESVTDILCFQNCRLERVDIPDSVVNIWDGAFQDCVYLSKIVLPERLEELNWEMFKGCTSLKKISVPGSVKKMTGSKFVWGLNSLQEIEYAGNETAWNTLVPADEDDFLSLFNIRFADGTVKEGVLAGMNIPAGSLREVLTYDKAVPMIETQAVDIDHTLYAEVPSDWESIDYTGKFSTVKDGTKVFRYLDEQGNEAEVYFLYMEDYYKSQDELFHYMDTQRYKPEKINLNGTDMILYLEEYDSIKEKTMTILYWSDAETILGVSLMINSANAIRSPELMMDMVKIIDSVRIGQE